MDIARFFVSMVCYDPLLVAWSTHLFKRQTFHDLLKRFKPIVIIASYK